jgi:hypothetical protein
VPWTFYAAMGKHSSDHGRHLTGGQVRVEDGLVRGVVTLTEEHWARYHRDSSYDSPHDTMITVARLLCDGPDFRASPWRWDPPSGTSPMSQPVESAASLPRLLPTLASISEPGWSIPASPSCGVVDAFE